jgi:hypothetical protein
VSAALRRHFDSEFVMDGDEAVVRQAGAALRKAGGGP